MDSYVIISTERLALQVFGRCPIALCATCDIDGCGKMSLQANIFPYGRITSRASKALKMPRVSENIESQYCGDIPPPALLRYHRSSVNGSNILWYEREFIFCDFSRHTVGSLFVENPAFSGGTLGILRVSKKIEELWRNLLK